MFTFKQMFSSFFLLAFCFSANSLWSQEPLVENNLFLKGIAKKGTAIYKKASTSGGKRLALKPFDIVYVYEKAGRSGFYRVGPDPSGPVGYIPADDLMEWNNRLCLHFTPLKGRKPALVFEYEGPLTECIRGSESFYDTNGKPHPNSIAMEPDDDLADQRFSMLLPILDQNRPRVGTGQNRLFQVGFLSGGDVNYASKHESSKVSSGKVAELELMFLIDATGSMQPYIDGTKKIVERVTERIIRSREGGCRFGVTAYRDYEDEFVYKQFSDLTRNSRSAISALHTFSAGGGHDTPEAVFDGFLGTLTETSWHETQNTLRIIVLIGDASAHQLGETGNPKNLSPEQLIRKASEVKVRTLAVKINPPDGDATGSSQFNYLAEGLTSADKGQYLEIIYDGRLTDDFINKTSAKIEAEIIRMEKLIKVVEDSKYSREPVFSRDITATDRAIILKNIKFEPGSPRPIEFSTGWINESTADGMKVTNTYAYMTKDEFDLMINYIKFSKNILSDPDKALAETMKETIEAATGETLKGKSIAAHYKKALSLPVKTDILKIPIDELATWGSDRKERLLKLIEGKFNQLELWGNNLENWNDAPGRGGFKYAFVPIDMLP